MHWLVPVAVVAVVTAVVKGLSGSKKAGDKNASAKSSDAGSGSEVRVSAWANVDASEGGGKTKARPFPPPPFCSPPDRLEESSAGSSESEASGSAPVNVAVDQSGTETFVVPPVLEGQLKGRARVKCLNKKGKWRKPYESEAAALQFAEERREEYGFQEPYECDECGKWHLRTLRSIPTSGRCSECTSKAGERKVAYPTEQDASEMAKRLLRQNKGQFRVYECPHDEGWHLTRVREEGKGFLDWLLG